MINITRIPINSPIPLSEEKEPQTKYTSSCEQRSQGAAFERLSLVGAGEFGKVYKGRCPGQHSPRVGKFINESQTFQQERMFLTDATKNRVPHTVVLRGFSQKEKSLILDDLGGPSLEKPEALLLLTDIALIFYQGLEALQGWKRMSWIHRDLKLENGIYTRQSKLLRFIDGGLAIKLPAGKKLAFQSEVGSSAYMAPEFWLGLPYDHSVDLWSLGVMIFNLYTGQEFLPLNNPSKESVLHWLDQTLGPIPAEFYEQSEALRYYCLPPLRESKTLGLKNPPVNRPHADWKKLLEETGKKRNDSPIQTERLIQLLNGIFTYKDRISLEEALNSPLFAPIFHFHLSCPANLPENYSLCLYQKGKLLSTYPLRQQTNDTCLHLIDQSKDQKGGKYTYELTVEKPDSPPKVTQKGALKLTPGSLIEIH